MIAIKTKGIFQLRIIKFQQDYKPGNQSQNIPSKKLFETKDLKCNIKIEKITVISILKQFILDNGCIVHYVKEEIK